MTPAVFYVDEVLGRDFPALLAAEGVPLALHADLFPHDATDEEKVREVSRLGLYWVGKGTQIYKNPVQVYDLLTHGIGYFTLTSVGTHEELADWFVRSVPAIGRFRQKHPRPFIASITRPKSLMSGGTVRLRRDRDDLPPSF